jgi:hypothetical protein
MNHVRGAPPSEVASTQPVRTSAIIPVYFFVRFLKHTVPAFREAAKREMWS